MVAALRPDEVKPCTVPFREPHPHFIGALNKLIGQRINNIGHAFVYVKEVNFALMQDTSSDFSCPPHDTSRELFMEEAEKIAILYRAAGWTCNYHPPRADTHYHGGFHFMVP